MFNDVMIVISWWLMWFLLGIVSFPLTWKWLGGLFDRGYAFAKMLGPVAVGYVVWLGVSLRIFEFDLQGLWVVLGIWTVINLLIVKGQFLIIKSVVMENWRLWVRLELLFFGVVLAWSTVRGFQPDINGLEKFMDFGFVQSILQSKTFPPSDMWFAGQNINYYYFGHFLSAMMMLLSGIKLSIAYNLMIATLMGLTVSLSVSLGASIVSNCELRIANYKHGKKIVIFGGLLTAFLLAVRGNLHLGAYFLNKWLSGGVSWLPNVKNAYWYPDATRYIPFTIHEFPMYSFVVADLHAHLINLPIVLLFLGGLIVVVNRSCGLEIKRNELLEKVKKMVCLFGKKDSLIYWWEVGIFGWLLGVFAMTNAWDVPIYGIVIGVTLFVLGIVNYKLQVIKNWVFLVVFLKKLLLIGGALVFLALLVSLPFQLNFEQIAQGVKRVDATSEFSKLLVLWGWDFFLFSSLTVYVASVLKGWSKDKLKIWDWIVLSWYCVGWLLVVIPELVYVKDIYIADYHRANTMFKLVYQSWVLFAICGAYTIMRLSGVVLLRSRNHKLGGKYIWLGWLIIVVLGLVAVGSYPRFAIRGYYGELKNYKGLDGEVWLAQKYPDDYAGIVWLRRLKNRSVVLEAVGDSYTEFDRVSVYTGYPTIEGWLVHEWLWRGSYDEPGARRIAVEHIYLANGWNDEKVISNLQKGVVSNIYTAKQLINMYRVDYVFVGTKEREKYPNLQEDKFLEIGKLVFERGETRIYKIDN